jgi:PD-(D/E)XK nuclease superfamily
VTTRRRSPFIWVTWLTPFLSGDNQCYWSLQFKAQHTYQKHERDDEAVSLAQWKADHAVLVEAHADRLVTEGWRLTLEDQNAFTLRGTSATLGGKPDIVATRPDVVRVIDGKTGQRRGSDIWQVLVYMFALPLAHPVWKDVPIHGQVVYRDGVVEVPALTGVARARIVDTIQRAARALDPTARVPSGRECSFCDIGRDDCPDRIEPVPAVTTAEF